MRIEGGGQKIRYAPVPFHTLGEGALRTVFCPSSRIDSALYGPFVAVRPRHRWDQKKA
jgi:hypothetical protein